MKFTKIPTKVEGTTRYTFVHEGRTGVVAGSGSFWMAGWVSPKREQWASVVEGPSRGAAVSRLVAS